MLRDPLNVSPAAHHRLTVRGQVGGLALDATMELTSPWTVLFGPSGSGKSTLLRALCGLLPKLDVTVGRQIGERSADLSRTPVHMRHLAYTPQGAVVFPHLSVQQNVAFAGESRYIEAALELFELAPLADRLPRDLSGGERQRVSLARAFAVPRARLMLLDEPFAGLDRRLRARLLPKMQAAMIARGIPVLSVTHDVEEALLLDAEVIRIDRGLVQAQGAARHVLIEEVGAIRRVLRENPAQDIC